MEKTKLAVCIEDEDYKLRFVKCVLKHYKELFEVYVVNQMCELKTEAGKGFGAVIVGDDMETEMDAFKDQVFLVLQEEHKEENTKENVYYTQKYQEVYKIIEKLQVAISENSKLENRGIKEGTIQRIGVYSLSKEKLQIPFSALLAEILGENHHVLVVDLQPFSGLAVETESEGALGMEDLISIAATENYTVHRLSASIGHEQKWEYIYPVKNTSCLAEVSLKTYEKMLEILEREQGYAYEIINFGVIFPGMMELMESCQQIYILTDNRAERNYRESCFLEEIQRRGKEDILKKFMWTEIPMEMVRGASWKQIAKQWLWSSLGDSLREIYWVEYIDGTDM